MMSDQAQNQSPPGNTVLPDAPPPSLSSNTTPTHYSRTDLLYLVQTPTDPIPAKLNMINDLLRRESAQWKTQWGVDEASAACLQEDVVDPFDGEPISKSLPIPIKDTSLSSFSNLSSDNGIDTDKVLMFDYQTPPNERAAPVLINFKNPFTPSSNQVQQKEKASSFFQSFPSSNNLNSRSSMESINLANSLSSNSSFKPKLGRSNSNSSSYSVGSASSFSSINSTSKVHQLPLNPFAAPFPLPETTPRLIPSSVSHTTKKDTSKSVSIKVPGDTKDEIPNIPLPKISSLPARPQGPIAPVFIRRESAALPQPMALPSVPPLGRDWEGENSLSGNERRRRGSLISSSYSSEFGDARRDSWGSSGTGDGVGPFGGSQSANIDGAAGGGAGQRPERLIKLGQRLRESIAAQGAGDKSGSVKA